ncbi:MAG: hypothetical protein V4792_18585 [Pseudomonadota bacterium]
MSIFSIKDVVDVPGVGESRMNSHFSQAPCGANGTARNTQRKAVFPLRSAFFPSGERVLSHAGITVGLDAALRARAHPHVAVREVALSCHA